MPVVASYEGRQARPAAIRNLRGHLEGVKASIRETD